LLVVMGLIYYYSLLIVGAKRSPTNTSRAPQRRFAIAIPAHNEAAVLPATLDQLQRQAYPDELFDIYVAADHCTDATAEVARAHGAICYERTTEPVGRKVYPLQWLLQKILTGSTTYDAVVVFDADSHVDTDFLRAMHQALGTRQRVVQGQHIIANPAENVFSGLAAADMRLNNLLRNQAKHNLGLSCRLMGDAMCFDAELLRQYGWPSDSLGEDREYGLYLLTLGTKIRYEPRAISYGQAAPSWHNASTQRVRWYGGVAEIQRKFAWPLLSFAFRKRSWAALDQAIELLLPPFSTLILLTGGMLGVQILWPSLPVLLPTLGSIGLLIAWMLFPLLGLRATDAPRCVYQALLYGPFYLVWRLWAGLRARLMGKNVRWIRTQRREEINKTTMR
jgi:cellulose synthase/poly-beta-1,6-N-acetylglucosamine synthase-like glycosyltransferase